MDVAACMEKIRQSFLPVRCKEMLCYDIGKIGKSGIESLQGIVLFGSCAMNQIRVENDIDLLVLTEKAVMRELRGELTSDLAQKKNGGEKSLVANLKGLSQKGTGKMESG